MPVHRRNNPNGVGFDLGIDEEGNYLDDYAPDQAIDPSTIPGAIPTATWTTDNLPFGWDPSSNPVYSGISDPDYDELTPHGDPPRVDPEDSGRGFPETDDTPPAFVGTPLGGFDETLSQYNDWDPFFRWAHEGAPQLGITRTPSYDPSRFASWTRESPEWAGGRFAGSDQAYEPYIGGGLDWSGFQDEYTGQSPRFLKGGPVDTGKARLGWTPQTAEEQAQGQQWLQQLEDAYSEYGATPYAQYARTGTSPGLEREQQDWNVLAQRYNLGREAAQSDWERNQQMAACLADGDDWDNASGTCTKKPDEPTLEEQCALDPTKVWKNGECVPRDDDNGEPTNKERCDADPTTYWDGARCLPIDTGNGKTNGENGTGDAAAIAACEAQNGVWNGTYCDLSGSGDTGVMSGGDLFPNAATTGDTGEVVYDPESAPLLPGEWQDLFTQNVADDPLSRISNAAIEALIRSGGVAQTDFTGQLEQQLADTMASQGWLPPSPDEQALSDRFQGIMDQGGVTDLTPLEQETQQNLRELIERGGAFPEDTQRRAMEIETARSPLDILRQSQLAEGRAAMAGRGLLGQGPEAEYGQRLEQRLAPMYTQAAQQIELDEKTRADERYRDAMTQLNQQALQGRISADQRDLRAQQLHTEITLDQSRRQDDRLAQAVAQSAALTSEQSRNLVGTINALTGVQKMRTDAALSALDSNMFWNKFVAEYSLDRAETMESLQQGRFMHLLPLISQFFQSAAQAAAGYTIASD